jgi:hypothetical protein
MDCVAAQEAKAEATTVAFFSVFDIMVQYEKTARAYKKI